MKNIDVTQSVMKNIASLERKRITSYRRKLFAVLGGLVLLFAGIVVFVIRILEQQQTFDLLTVFSEDREIIVEFWQDTVISFFQELPEPEIVIGGIVLCTVFAVVLVTRKKRSIMTRKEKEIQRYTIKEEEK
jgi:xanthine/uracil permease